MLRSLAEPEGYRLHALDGDVGHCRDFLFDDRQWTLRYMVADTGRWLPGRKVLISPAQLGEPDWHSRRMPVQLTQQQIEDSPPLDSDAPVSRRYEMTFNDFHAMPNYWLGSGLWGDYAVPSSMVSPQEMAIEPAPKPDDQAAQPTASDAEALGDDEHLRSVREVTGYGVDAVGKPEDEADVAPESVGRVADFIVDDRSWALRYLVVDTSRLPFSKKVLVPVELVAGIDWTTQKVRIATSAEQVDAAPTFDPTEPVNAKAETVLYDYYGRPHAHIG
jgi:hypothetical protein